VLGLVQVRFWEKLGGDQLATPVGTVAKGEQKLSQDD
jgi:hypothetical protein